MNTILCILQHALGRDQYGQLRSGVTEEYRNHFVAVGNDLELCREAVVNGWMVERKASPLTGGDPVFFVTDAGRKHMLEASPTPPRLTRSQEQYRAWARSDCGLSFGEWLNARRRADESADVVARRARGRGVWARNPCLRFACAVSLAALRPAPSVVARVSKRAGMIGCERLCGLCDKCEPLTWCLSKTPEELAIWKMLLDTGRFPEDATRPVLATLDDPSAIAELLARALRGRGVEPPEVKVREAYCEWNINRVAPKVIDIYGMTPGRRIPSLGLPEARAALSRLLDAGMCSVDEAMRLLEGGAP